MSSRGVPSSIRFSVKFVIVPQNIGVDFVVLAAGRVVEVPGVTVEQVEEILKRAIGDGDVGILLLDLVRQEIGSTP